MNDETKPPALPGEEWRGVVDLDGGAPGLCAFTEARAYYWTVSEKWRPLGPYAGSAVYRAAFLAERARAERAEAERNQLREALRAQRSATHAMLMERNEALQRGDDALLASSEANARAVDMHRRAQRLEGIEARLARVRAGYERFVAHLHLVAWQERRGARRRFRDVYGALKAAGYPWGTSSATKVIPNAGGKSASADAVELIGMLAAERDALAAQLRRLTDTGPQHRYQGRCPAYDGDPQRDPGCAVCRAMGAR